VQVIPPNYTFLQLSVICSLSHLRLSNQNLRLPTYDSPAGNIDQRFCLLPNYIGRLLLSFCYWWLLADMALETETRSHSSSDWSPSDMTHKHFLLGWCSVNLSVVVSMHSCPLS